MGKLFDDKGHRMSPSTARKAGRAYRYYISVALHQGQADKVGSVPRVAAHDIEGVILKALRQRCPGASSLSDDALLGRHLVRAALTAGSIEMDLDDGLGEPADRDPSDEADADDGGPHLVRVHIPWRRSPTRRAREIIVPTATRQQAVRPIDAATRSTLVRSIALGRRWLAEIIAGTVTGPEAIAIREGCSARRVAMMISLAFLAPDLVQAAIDGRLPRGIGFSRLIDPPVEWSRQHEMLGL